MQVELKVNGKTVHAEISEEQAKILGLVEDKPKTGYERVDEDESYFVDDTINDGHEVLGGRTLVNNLYYINGNYYNDKTIAENNARADRLQRCLRQWQAANDKVISISDWKNDEINKYFITYNYRSSLFEIGRSSQRREPNIIYFTTKGKVTEPIKNVRNE